MSRVKQITQKIKKLNDRQIHIGRSNLSALNLLIFVAIFASVGAYMVWHSFALTSTVLSAVNFDSSKSVSAVVVTENDNTSKRSKNVVELSDLPNAPNNQAVFLGTQTPLDTGQYQACVSARPVNAATGGIIQIKNYSNGAIGTTLGQGGYLVPQNPDYINVGCMTFLNYTPGATVAVVVSNGAINSVMRIGYVTLNRTGDLPPPPPTPTTPIVITPVNKQVVTGTVHVLGDVPNNVAIQKVELWFNGLLKLGDMTSTPSGWAYDLDTTRFGTTTGSLNVISFDNQGNKYTSPTRQIIMVNDASASASVVTVPSSIPADCSRDVTSDLVNFINSTSDGHTIKFAVNGCYQVDGKLDFTNRNNLTFEGNGATIKVMTDGSEFCPVPPDPNAGCRVKNSPIRGRHLWQFIFSSNITFHNLNVRGANPYVGTDARAYDVNREAQHLWTFGAGCNNITLDSVKGYQSYGDFVFLAGVSNVAIRNSTFDSNGRMGLTTNSGTNIVFDNNTVSNTRRSVWDIEPPSYSGPPTDLLNITFSNNHVNPGYVGFYFLSDTGGQQNSDNILMINNHLTGKALSVHEANQKTWPVRKNFRILGNESDTAFSLNDGSGMFFSNSDGVEVRANHLVLGNLSSKSGVGVDNAHHIWITDNNFEGGISSLWLYNLTDTQGPSDNYCYSKNYINSPPMPESSSPNSCSSSFNFQ